MSVPGVPGDLLDRIRSRSNRKEQSRFPYKLWDLLSWSGRDPARLSACGCGWKDDDQFYINKSVLCTVMDIKPNTLNVNLRELGFVKLSREEQVSIWKHPSISENDRSGYFGSIRNVRSRPESVAGFSVQEAYLPLLEPLELFLCPNFQQANVNQFKYDVIIQWEKLIQSELTFAVPRDWFIDLLMHHIAPTQDSQFDGDLLDQVLESRIPWLVEVLDFAKLMARFGPFRTFGEKLKQYHNVIRFQHHDLFMPVQAGEYFARTFHNCFCFRASQNCGEYHFYNLPYADSNSQYLVDEDDVVYVNWEQMLKRHRNLITVY
jgi:hypothetical protein